MSIGNHDVNTINIRTCFDDRETRDQESIDDALYFVESPEGAIIAGNDIVILEFDSFCFEESEKSIEAHTLLYRNEELWDYIDKKLRNFRGISLRIHLSKDKNNSGNILRVDVLDYCVHLMDDDDISSLRRYILENSIYVDGEWRKVHRVNETKENNGINGLIFEQTENESEGRSLVITKVSDGKVDEHPGLPTILKEALGELEKASDFKMIHNNINNDISMHGKGTYVYVDVKKVWKSGLGAIKVYPNVLPYETCVMVGIHEEFCWHINKEKVILVLFENSSAGTWKYRSKSKGYLSGYSFATLIGCNLLLIEVDTRGRHITSIYEYEKRHRVIERIQHAEDEAPFVIMDSFQIFSFTLEYGGDEWLNAMIAVNRVDSLETVFIVILRRVKKDRILDVQYHLKRVVFSSVIKAFNVSLDSDVVDRADRSIVLFVCASCEAGCEYIKISVDYANMMDGSIPKSQSSSSRPFTVFKLSQSDNLKIFDGRYCQEVSQHKIYDHMYDVLVQIAHVSETKSILTRYLESFGLRVAGGVSKKSFLKIYDKYYSNKQSLSKRQFKQYICDSFDRVLFLVPRSVKDEEICLHHIIYYYTDMLTDILDSSSKPIYLKIGLLFDTNMIEKYISDSVD